MIVGVRLTFLLIRSYKRSYKKQTLKFMKNQDKNPCIDCNSFDNSQHINDPRTMHAGICKKWSQITFISDTCKQYIPIQELCENDIFKEPLIDVSKLPAPNQLSFF